MDTPFPTSRRLKEQARQLRRDNAPRPTRVTLLYWLLGSALTTLISGAAALFLPTSQDTVSAPEIFLSLLLNLFGVVLAYGYDRWMFWTSRGERLGYDAVLDGFSEVGRVILAHIWVVLYLLPWALLISFGATFALLVLYNFFAFALRAYGPYAFGLLMTVFFGVIYVLLYLIALRYELIHFLLAEFDQLTPAQAVRRSAQLMRGQIGRMFRLKLSFLGWYLLNGALSCGVFLAAAYPHLMTMFQMLETATEMEWILYLQQLQAILNSGLVSGLTMLISLPVFLYLVPYQRLTEAQFYTRLTRPEPEAPPWQEGF